MSDEAEILRLRDRYHSLRSEVDAHELLLVDTRKRLDVLEPNVDELSQAAKIAQAIARQAHADRRLALTVAQKIGVAFVGAVTLADTILRLVGV